MTDTIKTYSFDNTINLAKVILPFIVIELRQDAKDIKLEILNNKISHIDDTYLYYISESHEHRNLTQVVTGICDFISIENNIVTLKKQEESHECKY